jgi:two-component system chemotaxis response regulator CheY
MKRVLVVDDSPAVRQQVSYALSTAGFSVVEAVDGVDGHTRIKAGDIGMVICDVNMPRMDGLEMVEAVRKLPGQAALPIIMLTSESSDALMARGRKAGVKGWVVKPFKADLLIGAVKKLILA